MKFIVVFLALVCKAQFLFSQFPAKGKVLIEFAAVSEGARIDLGSKFSIDGDSVEVSSLKFYISNIEFFQDDKMIFRDPIKAHLIDYSFPESMNIEIEIIKELKYDFIAFQLGIDSATNVRGALDGDLDPTKGMYWTWQSGYVNFKLEGKSAIRASKDGMFRYHLGGYLSPNLCVQNLGFSIEPSKSKVFNVDLNKVLSAIDFSENHTIMSPSLLAVALSKLVAESISYEGK